MQLLLERVNVFICSVKYSLLCADSMELNTAVKDRTWVIEMYSLSENCRRYVTKKRREAV